MIGERGMIGVILTQSKLISKSQSWDNNFNKKIKSLRKDWRQNNMKWIPSIKKLTIVVYVTCNVLNSHMKRLLIIFSKTDVKTYAKSWSISRSNRPKLQKHFTPNKMMHKNNFWDKKKGKSTIKFLKVSTMIIVKTFKESLSMK